MKFARLAIVAVAVVPTFALVSPSAALAPGEVDVRSVNADYERGESIEWTVDVVEQKAGADPSDEVIVNLRGPHDLVPGSISVPRGWSISFSDNGEDYVDDPPADVTHVKFVRTSKTSFPDDVAAVAMPDDILVRNLIPRPVPAISTARSGGDGYIPMLAGDRIYAVWHHLPAGGTPEPHMVCIDTLTGKTCPNYPKVLGWQTSYNQGQGIHIDNRLYFKNRDATTHGVLCWNTATERSCGYTPVAKLGPVTGTAGGDGGWDQFSSPVLHAGRLYFAGHNFRVYCFDPKTDAACADYGLDGKATARFGEPHATTRRINDILYHDGRMIFSLATSWADTPVPLGTKDVCFDLTTSAPCADWGTNGVVTETAGTAYLFARYDGTGKVIGFCHGVRSGAGEVPLEATTPCYDLNGRNRTTIRSTQPFGQFRPYNVEEATIGTRTFFGRYSTLGAYCYDWATEAPCAGQYFDSNGRSTQSLAEHFYGFVRRGECMIGLGHKGVFMSVDPLTGGTPCRKLVDSNFVASAASRYCGDTKYLTGWRLALASDVGARDFDRLEVTVTDGVTSVSGDMLTGVLALAGLDPNRDLTVNVNGSVKSNVDPWGKGTPALNFLYGGSSQFCFRTIAKKATTPISVGAETETDSDREIVPLDTTPEGVAKPDDPNTPQDEGAGDSGGEPTEQRNAGAPDTSDDIADSGDQGGNGDEDSAEQTKQNSSGARGELPATGTQMPGVVAWATFLVAFGGLVVLLRRVGPSVGRSRR